MDPESRDKIRVVIEHLADTPDELLMDPAEYREYLPDEGDLKCSCGRWIPCRHCPRDEHEHLDFGEPDCGA